VDFSTFGFQAEVTFAEAGFSDAVDEFSVDGEFDGAVDGDDDIAVPLTFGEAAVFEGFAAGTSWVVGDGFHAASSEEFAVDIGKWAGNAVPGMDEGPFEFEHLDFHAFGETVAFGAGITPEEDSGITASFHVSPFDNEDEVLVHFLGSHDSDRMSRTDKQTFVIDGPGVVRSVHIDPTTEVLAIEEIDELWIRPGFFLAGNRDSGQSILWVFSGLVILLGTGIKAKGKGGQNEEEAGSSSHDTGSGGTLEMNMSFSSFCPIMILPMEKEGWQNHRGQNHEFQIGGFSESVVYREVRWFREFWPSWGSAFPGFSETLVSSGQCFA